MAKFSLRDSRVGPPDIMWGKGSNYGHITVCGWSQKSEEMRALEDAATNAITERIIAFLNESAPSEVERVYEAAVEEGRS